MNRRKNFNDKLEKLLKTRQRKTGYNNKSFSSNYSVAMHISIELITGIALGFFLGMVLDNYLQTKPLMLIIFILLGILVGFYNMYKTLKKYGYFK